MTDAADFAQLTDSFRAELLARRYRMPGRDGHHHAHAVAGSR